MGPRGKARRCRRRERGAERRALMRGRREAHKLGLDVRLVGAQAIPGVWWEAWHESSPRNLREGRGGGIPSLPLVSAGARNNLRNKFSS